MNDDNLIGSALGQLGQTAKKVGQQVTKLPMEMSKDMSEQLGGSAPRQGSEGQAKPQEQAEWKSDEERIKFLKDLYGPSQSSAGKAEQNPSVEKKPENHTSANPLISAVEKKKPSEFQEEIKDKSPEEQKELMQLRNQLHKEVYYDPTFSPPKKQEERPAEKVEKEKKQEMAELQQKEAKKPVLAVHREQNKTEMFRGVSG